MPYMPHHEPRFQTRRSVIQVFQQPSYEGLDMSRAPLPPNCALRNRHANNFCPGLG